jgi:hypothetical protein
MAKTATIVIITLIFISVFCFFDVLINLLDLLSRQGRVITI